jgi:hypothetical protein
MIRQSDIPIEIIEKVRSVFWAPCKSLEIYFWIDYEKYLKMDLNGSEYTPVAAKVLVMLATKLYCSHLK